MEEGGTGRGVERIVRERGRGRRRWEEEPEGRISVAMVSSRSLGYLLFKTRSKYALRFFFSFCIVTCVATTRFIVLSKGCNFLISNDLDILTIYNIHCDLFRFLS